MKLTSFHFRDDPPTAARFGALIDDDVIDFEAEACAPRGVGRYLDWFDLDGAALQHARQVVESAADPDRRQWLREQGGIRAAEEVRLLAPVPRPGKVICIGLNYRDHAEESGMDVPESPVVFSKFPTSVIGPEAPVLLPRYSEQVDYEAELAVVIGRRANDVKIQDAAHYVLGYTNCNDVSARDFQFADGQWQRGKSCDTFCPLGPYIATDVADPHNLSIRLRLNGETMQDSNTDQLIFGVFELIAFLSQDFTLEPGDVIATGTPPGVGFARKPPVFVKAGDTMEVEVEGLGTLRSVVSPKP